MSIRTMCDENTPGAVKNEYWSKQDEPIYTHTWAVGMVVYTGEYNGHDDSDFYAIYYDEKEDTFKRCEYATTRFWSYPNSASVDATPEIQEKYVAYKRACARKSKAYEIRRHRKFCQAKAKETGFTARQIKRLQIACPGNDQFIEALKLLKTLKNNRFRSEFRKSLATQIATWMTGPSEYETPLSHKQWSYLNPFRTY